MNLNHTGVTANAGAYNSVNITWNTSRAGTGYPGNNYDIRVGATNCAMGSVVQSGLTPATPNTNVVTNLPAANFPTNGTSYGIMICVKNYAGAQGYQTTAFSVMRDDTAPIFSGLNSIGPAGSGAFTLGWSTATDSNSGIGAYRIYQSTTSLTYAATPNFVATAPANNFTVTGLNPLTTYYYVAGAVDNAGNETKVVTLAAEMPTKPTITLIVAGLSGNFTLTDGTSTNTISANTVGSPWVTTLGTGATYNFRFTAQPPGQVCAIPEQQFGTLNANITIHVNCVNGYLTGESVRALAPAKLSYRLFQGKSWLLAGTYTTSGSANGSGPIATFNFPEYMAITGGFAYIADSANYRIRKMNLTSPYNVSTLAGSAFGAANATDDGACASAKFASVTGVAVDGTNLYTADFEFGRIRKIQNIGGTCTVTTLAGTGSPGFADGAGTSAQFSQPRQLALVGDSLFVADTGNNRVRRIALSTGVVATLAGNGTASDAGGTGTGASIASPLSLAAIGNNLYVGTGGQHIVQVDLATNIVTIVAGDGTSAYADGTASNARLNMPMSMTTDGADLYFVEYNSHLIRRVEINQNFRVTTLAGQPQNLGSSMGIGVTAQFNTPNGITSDGRSLFVSNHDGQTIQRLSDNGLVGYWPINPGVNPNDYNSDNATVNNGAVSSFLGTTNDRFGVVGRASTFDGTQRVTTSDGGLPMGSSTRTMCAWINPNMLPAANWAVFLAYGSAGVNQGAGLNLYNGSAYGPVGDYIVFFGYGAGPGTDFAIPYTTSTTQWTHICGSYYNNTATIFINGHKIGSRGGFSWNTVLSGTLNIGQQITNTQGFNGAIADVRIYNRALNEGEINELAQDASAAQVGASMSSGATGLLTHYEFNGGASTPSGPVGGNLTPSGSPTTVLGKDGDTNGAMNFNGSTSYFAGAAVGLPIAASPRTLCAWIMPASYPANGNRMLITQYGNTSTGGGAMDINLTTSAGVVGIQMSGYGLPYELHTTYTPPLNTWSHVCGVYSGGTVGQIFVNGSAIASSLNIASPWNTVATPAEALNIGRHLNNQNYFAGKIDDVRIYDNALTAMQIRQLATQVPAGLVARYDFTGDFSDVSGFGQNLTNNGATLANDRFGAANTAVNFAAPANLNATVTGFPLGTSPRTICAWTNPSTLFPSAFSEVTMYGASTAGWGFGMDARAPNNGSIFILDAVGDWIYNKPHGLSIWRHICATYDGSTENLYLDGNLLTGVARGLTTASGQIVVGRGIFGSNDYFNGSIDDVRVYNRALSLAEMQALVQQQNKRIYVTAQMYSGNLMTNGGVVGSPTGATGIAGADAKCNWASDTNKPATGTYKAMLGGGVANLRRACTSASCVTGGITENIDWVLRPNITYTRSTNLPIFTANWNGVWDFFGSAPTGGNFTNAIAASGTPWTGVTATWISDTACGSWDDTGGATDNKAVFGDATATSQTAAPGGVIYQNWAGGTTGTFVVCGSSAYPLYCVEQ